MKRLLCIFFFLPNIICTQSIITCVGTGVYGYYGNGGLADTATIAAPGGLNFDDSGNLLICQADLVRSVNKITNIITIVAGSDTASSSGGGGDGGPATRAAIVVPLDICVDSAGNYFIADNWYSEVRRVNITTGIIDTFAGNRNPGDAGDGGPAKHARLSGVWGVRFDTGQRYLYISNEFNYRVRKVDMTTNIISAFAGSGISGYSGDGGPAVTAKFSRVLGISVDRSNNVYIGDWDNARIRKVNAVTGIVTTVIGNGTNGYSGDGGPATAAMIAKPSFSYFDKCGNLFFTDEDNNRVRRVDVNTNIITTIAGNGIAGYAGDGGLAINAEFNHPTGIAIDTEGNIFISDYYNNRVRKTTYPNPYVHLTASPNDTTVYGTPVTFTTTVSGGGDAPGYEWFVNGIAVSGATGSSYTYTPVNGDSISCILTSNSQCVGAHTAHSNIIRMSVWPLDVPEVNATQQISIFPNPAHDVVTVSATGRIKDMVVSNMVGQIMKAASYPAMTSKAEIDITALPAGLYFVKVNGAYVQRFVKE